MTVEPKGPKQAHQVVGDNDEAEEGFSEPKVLQAARDEPEVLIQFIDPILTTASSCLSGCLSRCARFAVRSAVVDIPDLIQRQVEIGQMQAEVVVGQDLKEQLAKEPAIGALAGHAIVTEDGGESSILTQPIELKIAAGPSAKPGAKTFNNMHQIVGTIRVARFYWMTVWSLNRFISAVPPLPRGRSCERVSNDRIEAIGLTSCISRVSRLP